MNFDGGLGAQGATKKHTVSALALKQAPLSPISYGR